MEKLVHTLTTFQAMEACVSHNLCAGLKSGIEGVVHASKRAFGRKTPSNAVLSDSHPKGASGLETVWEGRSKPEDSKEEYKEVKALLTQPPPQWQGYRETNDRENSTEEEPFVRGNTRGDLQPEEDLAGCILADAANGFNNLSRLAMLWTVAH